MRKKICKLKYVKIAKTLMNFEGLREWCPFKDLSPSAEVECFRSVSANTCPGIYNLVSSDNYDFKYIHKSSSSVVSLCSSNIYRSFQCCPQYISRNTTFNQKSFPESSVEFFYYNVDSNEMNNIAFNHIHQLRHHTFCVAKLRWAFEVYPSFTTSALQKKLRIFWRN